MRDSEKAGILAKIAGNAWATSVYNGMVSRVAADLASHQSNRDAFLRGLPVVDWTAATPKFKTIPAYSESSVRFPAEAKFNDAVDCAVLYYLTGDANYARCAGDILHNAVKTLLPVTASTNTGNGGWIFQTDFLKEARVTGTQLPIVYDFLYSWLQTNQVYDVKTAGMVNFNFTNAQSVFRKYYQLTRDHGQKESNWSALMSTTMLNNLLALDDSAERATALQIYLITGTSKQASLDYDYRHYTQTGDIWPESLAIRRRGRLDPLHPHGAAGAGGSEPQPVRRLSEPPAEPPAHQLSALPERRAGHLRRRPAPGNRRPAVLPIRTRLSTRAGPRPDRSHLVLRLAHQRRRGRWKIQSFHAAKLRDTGNPDRAAATALAGCDACPNRR